MGNTDEKNELISNYLQQVKKRLPSWLKEKRSEVKDIIDEIEMHIWDKAEEISGGGSITTDAVRQALVMMGSPSAIAKEYQKRGKPKVFISEELWPYYKRLMIWICCILTVLYYIKFFFDRKAIAAGEVLPMDNIESLVYIIPIGITLLFVVFSMKGYFPEDISLNITKDARIRAEVPTKRLKKIIPTGSTFLLGLFSISIGLLFLFTPLYSTEGINLTDQFKLMFRIWGGLEIAIGVVYFILVITEKTLIKKHQVYQFLIAALDLGLIVCLVWLSVHPEHFPFDIENITVISPFELENWAAIQIVLYIFSAWIGFRLLRLVYRAIQLPKLMALN